MSLSVTEEQNQDWLSIQACKHEEQKDTRCFHSPLCSRKNCTANVIRSNLENFHLSINCAQSGLWYWIKDVTPNIICQRKLNMYTNRGTQYWFGIIALEVIHEKKMWSHSNVDMLKAKQRHHDIRINCSLGRRMLKNIQLQSNASIYTNSEKYHFFLFHYGRFGEV